ncbi:hypothetical protein B0H11DRAFT_2212210 [Mycena galericulata]|nr:hypothetical protein B0H11DRAFT_2212210 [Mycena galericulata]
MRTDKPRSHANDPPAEADCDYIQMALLARQTSALWILPAVFYRMCRHSHLLEYQIINGGASGELRTCDKIVYIRAARFLESAGISNILDFLWFPTEIKGCRDRDGCVETRHKFRRIAESRRRFSPEDEIAIMPLEVWERKDWENLDVCSRCLATMKRTHQAARDSLWTRLPEIFELPDWDCLEGMRAEALC